MIKKFKIKNIFKILIALIVIAIMSMVISKTSQAYMTWVGDATHGMPTMALYNGHLLPQNLNGGVGVFCCDNGAGLRNGQYDSKIYYPTTGDTYSDAVSQLTSNIKNEAMNAIGNVVGLDGYVSDSVSVALKSITINQKEGPSDSSIYNIDTNQPIFILNPYVGSGDPYDTSIIYNQAFRTLQSIMNSLKVNVFTSPVPISDSSVNFQYEYTRDTDGAAVCIMEQSPRAAQNGETPEYKSKGNVSIANDQGSYILSAATTTPFNGQTAYSLTDVQTAWWELVDTNGYNENTLSAAGKALKREAETYEKFVQALGGSSDEETTRKKYKESISFNIDKDKIQVIANQNDGTYIVGPLSVKYLDYENISYMTQIRITSKEGKTIVYNANEKQFDVFCDKAVSGSTKFPASGTQFYVKFKAAALDYTTGIKFGCDFQYVSSTSANYNKLDTTAGIYRYHLYSDAGGGEYPMRRAYLQGSADFTYAFKKDGGETATYSGTYNTSTGSYTVWYENSKGIATYETGNFGQDTGAVEIVQPFVRLEYEKTDKAQPLAAVISASRPYLSVSQEFEYNGDGGDEGHEGETEDDKNIIDLTMELGGKVWEDGKAGKESKSDGVYNESSQVDTPMEGMKVTLYAYDLNGNLKQIDHLVKNEDGTYTNTGDYTLTDKNGNYAYVGLNAMYQYFVKFTYNGQYYQPTIYNVDRKSEYWSSSSKGMDIADQRDQFNAKFEEIGSSPENVNGFSTYTREELEEMGAIDNFGNATDKETEGTAYAKYCMTDSYTCNGSNSMDLYPGDKVFVISDHLNREFLSTDLLNFIGSKTITILYGNPDIMHHINQGYTLRETADLALRKDVYQATLEINGKSETYTYNKRDGLEKDADGNSYWEITTRISDAYYDQNYSRELYREDYGYKVDDYGTMASEMSTDKELKVYATYKIDVRNQSGTINGIVTEIVDYYDSEYTLIGSDNNVAREQKYKPYLGTRNGKKIADLTTSTTSIYGNKTQSNIDGYNTTYITGMDKTLITTGADMYIYITFSVNKDNNRCVILDEELESGTPIGNGKENVSEINGYKTYYSQYAEAPNKDNTQVYKVEYSEGDIAGLIDIDSKPGNLDPNDVQKDGKVNYDQFEDDTDKAPNLRIILNRQNVREINGTVFEDSRDRVSSSAQIGDGAKKDSDTGINGVRVQFVELLSDENGNIIWDGNKPKEFLWKEIRSGNTDPLDPIINVSNLIAQYNVTEAGKYEFRSFVPGNYIVRFIYGDGIETVLSVNATDYSTGATILNPVTEMFSTETGYKKAPNTNNYSAANGENLALNAKSYNGQDYKSTTYQVIKDEDATINETGKYTYDYERADEHGELSDAKDIMARREQVQSYSNSNVLNDKAEKLASFEKIPTYNGTQYTKQQMADMITEFMQNTTMIAETGVIGVNFEYNRSGNNDGFTNTSDSGNQNVGSSNYEQCGFFSINNVDLGLEERPKAQLKTTKEVTNVKITLANGSTLFDASAKATNVLWIDHKAHGQDVNNTYKINDNYATALMKTPNVRQQAADKGKIQITMDEELMHGATIKITYGIFVANVGEVDYKENSFYYTGYVSNTNNIVKTTVNKIVDYVGYNGSDDTNATRNNLQFEENNGWTVIDTNGLKNDGLVNSALENQLNMYKTKVQKDLDKDLVPIIVDEGNAKAVYSKIHSDRVAAVDTANNSNSIAATSLVLSQVITSQNTSDDMTYNNMVEIVKTGNTVGRRMNYSIVGNQNPINEPNEIDADDAQEITILPPFGQKYIYYILGSAIAVILIVGVVLIKKKVINK